RRCRERRMGVFQPWLSPLAPSLLRKRSTLDSRLLSHSSSPPMMDSASLARQDMLSDEERGFLARQKIAHLDTAHRGASPPVVPVCFVLAEETLYITIDQKPKRRPGAPLKRLRNIAENPAVALVVDRYDEDWSRLSWVMLHGRAEILTGGTEHHAAQM